MLINMKFANVYGYQPKLLIFFNLKVIKVICSEK
jgi:hypothetical protein